MLFSAHSIGRKRYRAARAIRFGAVVLFTVWLVAALFALSDALRYSPTDWVEAGADALGVWPLLAGAAFLALGARRLAAWIVPLPRPGCPVCGYDAAHAGPGGPARCPECGVPLGEPPGPSGPLPPPLPGGP